LGLEITGETKLVGIFGDPVSHSLSPRMQNAAFAAMGLNMCYVPLHVAAQDLNIAVDGLRAMKFVGANVTIPHKVSILKFMDKLDDSAEKTGAVNTIVNDDGTLTGHNTDGPGFIRSLEEKMELDYPSTPVLITGAGGAARSISSALAAKGVPRITIVNRTIENALALRETLINNFPGLEVQVTTPDADYGDQITDSKIVINATSLGMDGPLKTAPLIVDRLTKDHVVCDIVYTRSQENPLLVAAQQKGAITLGGMGMLLHQGALAIHLWTGLEPPIEVMRRLEIQKR